MCKFRLLDVIISNNETQFTKTTVTDFCHELDVQTKFISIVHPQEHGLAESVNKVILKGIKKRLGAELLHEILWSYHKTTHSTTKETIFAMVYRLPVMLHVEINTPSWKRFQFNPEVNNV